MSIRDILPDSRARETKGRVFTPCGTYIPVFCANCGADGGYVTEESITHFFYLCNSCVGKYGPIAATMTIPDEVFFQQMKELQLATYGRILTDEELVAIVEANASPLATLLKGRRPY